MCTDARRVASFPATAAGARPVTSAVSSKMAAASNLSNPIRYCAVYDCTNNYKTRSELAYFILPPEPDRLKLWLQKIRREDLMPRAGRRVSGYHRVCEEHFEPQFINANRTRRRLSRRAVPTLRLPHGASYTEPRAVATSYTEPRPAAASYTEPRAAAASYTEPRPAAASYTEPRAAAASYTEPRPAAASYTEPRAAAASYTEPRPAAASYTEPRAAAASYTEPRPAAASYTEPRAAAAAPLLSKSALEVFHYLDETPKRRKREPPPDFCRPAPPPAAPADLADFFSGCDRHLHPQMAHFVKTIAELRRKGDGEGLNEFCVRLLHAGPPAYRLLRGALGLPAERAVRRLCKPLLLDFDSEVAALLELRVDRMTETERHCTISVDFIDLKPHLYYDIASDRIIGLEEVDGKQSPSPATRCVVVTARGLRAGWAQHAALCAPGPGVPLAAWLDGVLRRLLALGLRVCALVTDPALELREVLPEKPFFVVDGQRIYRIYDVPRLMKFLLCHFMMYEFHFEGMVAKWSDVLEYHHSERSKRLTLTPHLTDEHTDVASVRRMRPRRAARALAAPLPAALAARPPARHTLMFLLKINNLYDILDTTATRASSDFKRGLTENSEQVGFLTYMSAFFKNLKLKKSSGATVLSKLSERWRVTIESALALRRELPGPAPPAARLQLADRVSAPLGDRPSYRRVVALYRKQFANDLLQPPDKQRYEDLNVSLSRVLLGEGERIVRNQAFEVEEETTPKVRASDYRAFLAPRRGGLAAAAAHALRAAGGAHGGCARGAAWAARAARAPGADVLRLARRLDAALAAALLAPSAARARLADLLLDLHVLDCDLPCACFPLHYFKKLFLRLRLYSILRQTRAAFKKCNGDYQFIVKTLE